jgi:cyclomaltodextrin glucanotransferase
LHQRIQAFLGRDDWQGTFIDNHDQIRTMTRLEKIGVPTEMERRERMDLASVLLLTVRGIPIIYYGDEQYLALYDAPVDYQKQYINSGSDDPWNRPGMQSWDETTPAFRIISALAYLRKSDPAVWRGTYRTLYADADVLIYERVAGRDVVLAAVNRGQAKDVALQGSLGFVPGTYRGLIADASPANAGNYVRIGRQTSLVHLGAISALVLRN